MEFMGGQAISVGNVCNVGVRVGAFQSGPKVKPLVEPAPSTSLGRREHRFRRATDLSQWIRRPSSQISATRAACSPAEDRRQGAHRSRQGKFSHHLSQIDDQDLSIIEGTESGPFVNSEEKISASSSAAWRSRSEAESRRDFRSSEARHSSVAHRSTTDIPSYWIPSVRHATPARRGLVQRSAAWKSWLGRPI